MSSVLRLFGKQKMAILWMKDGILYDERWHIAGFEICLLLHMLYCFVCNLKSSSDLFFAH